MTAVSEHASHADLYVYLHIASFSKYLFAHTGSTVKGQ